MSAVEVTETAKYGFCDLTEDVDANWTKLARYPVQSSIKSCQLLPIWALWGSDLPHIHILHAHNDIPRVILEGAIEVDDVV